MAEPDERALAEQRFEQALEGAGARDPRDFYRQRLRALRDRDPRAYRQAVEHYEQRLIPRAAAEGGDPLRAWLEYGQLLAELVTPGRTVQIDPSGRAHELAHPVPADHLVLHLPTSTREPALVVGLPARLSPPQRATYDLLVSGSQG